MFFDQNSQIILLSTCFCGHLHSFLNIVRVVKIIGNSEYVIIGDGSATEVHVLTVADGGRVSRTRGTDEAWEKRRNYRIRPISMNREGRLSVGIRTNGANTRLVRLLAVCIRGKSRSQSRSQSSCRPVDVSSGRTSANGCFHVEADCKHTWSGA